MRSLALACLVIFVASGPWCAGSEEPIASAADAVIDSALVGQWRSDDTSKREHVTVAPMRARGHYLLRFFGDSGKTARFELTVTRIDSVLFGDLYPTEEDRHEGTLSIDIHLVMRLSHANDTIAIRYMRPSWLQRYAAAHPDEISTVTLGDWVVMTDSTAKVRRFLLSTLNADSAYAEPDLLVKLRCTPKHPCPSKPHH